MARDRVGAVDIVAVERAMEGLAMVVPFGVRQPAKRGIGAAPCVRTSVPEGVR